MDEEDHELVFVDSARKRRSLLSKTCHCTGLVLGCLAFLAAVGLAVALTVIITREGGEGEHCESVCRTESCEELAKTVDAAMDTSIDPCDDFYSFSCGGWVKANPIPPGRSRYSPFNQLDERNKAALIKILEGRQDDDIEAVQTLRQLYNHCMDLKTLDEMGAQPLLDLIQLSVGGWPLVNDISSGSGSGLGPPPYDNFINSPKFVVSKLKGSPAFFALYVSVDDKNSSHYTIFLEQDGLTLPSAASYASKDLVDSAKAYAVDILSLLNPKVSREVYVSAVEKIFQLEIDLASIFLSPVALRDPEATYNNMTVQQLTEKFSGSFKWDNLVNTSFSKAGAKYFGSKEQIIVRTPSYFHNLTEVVSKTEDEVLFNYAMWQFTKGYIPYLSQNFLTVYYNFTEAVYGRGNISRNETCLGIAQEVMPIALARPYTEFVLPGALKGIVEGMISQVKTAFKERVNASSWLEPQTKTKCYEKVDDIAQRVAYPDEVYHETALNALYENYTFHNMVGFLLFMANAEYLILTKNLRRLHTTVDRMEWDIAPTAVNAYYNPSFNQFTFLEGILAPPFIAYDWPPYFTYGAFGTVIGHELTHGFDDQGQQYDAHGNLKRWWDNTSTTRFKDRQKCFVDQYSRYQIFGHHVNGSLTLGENLADNGGLKTSYQAYRNVVEKEGIQSSLPGLKYTPDQLFFVAFAQLWCSHFTPEYIATAILTDPHSPGPFRVNGTLVNSQKFADTFKCREGSPMNPKDKCLMW